MQPYTSNISAARDKTKRILLSMICLSISLLWTCASFACSVLPSILRAVFGSTEEIGLCWGHISAGELRVNLTCALKWKEIQLGTLFFLLFFCHTYSSCSDPQSSLTTLGAGRLMGHVCIYYIGVELLYLSLVTVASLIIPTDLTKQWDGWMCTPEGFNM